MIDSSTGNDLAHFHHVIGPLLSRIGMSQAQDSERWAVMLSVDESLTVGLLGHQPGYLIMIAGLPEPVDTGDAQRLLPLLSANHFTAEHPPLIGSIEGDSGRFSLWVRQALVELDEASLMALFDRLLAAASAVRDWLQEPMSAAFAREPESAEWRV